VAPGNLAGAWIGGKAPAPRMETAVAHRIISLDGGGAWAVLEAMALGDIFGAATPGHQILRNFDLAVSNSGGSIVLGGLVEDMTPAQIVDLFNLPVNREAIFAKTGFVENLLSHIPIFPKYSTLGKLAGLTAAFGAMGPRPLSSLTGGGWPQSNGADVKILMVAFDYDSMRARYFRSYSTPHGATADDVPMVQAVHASSDAPVIYFDAPTQWAGRRYWDGAMAGLNNPLLAGLTDLLSDGVPANDICVLTLGTGTVKLAPPTIQPPAPAALSQPWGASGVLPDLEKASGCIADDPPDMASFSTHVVLSAARGTDPTQVGPVVRLSPIVRPVLTNGAWSVPEGLTADQFSALATLGMDAVEQDQMDLITTLGDAWIADRSPNQPIRMNSDDLSSSLGEELYSAAKARWKTLCP